MAKKRRKRKRQPPPRPATDAAAPPAVAADDRQRAVSARRARGVEGRPEAPWGSFPLTELVILTGIVLLIAGYFVEPPRGTVMLVTGLGLAALGGLELSVREHFAGYKSHTMALAGTVAVASAGMLIFAAKVAPAIGVGCGAALFLLAAWGFAVAFRHRSGGALYRFKPEN